MRFLLVGCLTTLFLFGCNGNSSKELNSEPTVAEKSKIPTKDEMISYYDKKSNGEIKQIFKEQNIGGCINEFQSQNIPNARVACDCVMDNMTQQLSISDLKTMLLPAEYVSTDTINEIQRRSVSAMLQAMTICSNNQ